MTSPHAAWKRIRKDCGQSLLNPIKGHRGSRFDILQGNQALTSNNIKQKTPENQTMTAANTVHNTVHEF